MMRSGDLEYALARIASRIGERPTEAAWRSIAVIRDFAALIDAARQQPFGRWMAGIGRESGAHAIETALRASWRALGAEVRLWMPEEWQAAVDWATDLVDLPAAIHLARGEPLLGWMRDDATYRELGSDPRLANSDPDLVMRAWGDEWQRRAPQAARDDAILRELAGLVRSEPRRSLGARLSHLYRRATLDPAAAFIFLAMSALDMERLRGELLRRAVFPTIEAAA